jgi:YD repeat-containing protein
MDPHNERFNEIVEEPVSLHTTRNSDYELDLLDLLLMSRDLQATDPLDKIYALLGLGRHEMIPDYSSTTETVFCDFALQVIGAVTRPTPGSEEKLLSDDENVRKALILLSCAGRSNQNLEELPSWVPDWTANLASRPFIFDPNFSAGGSVMEKLDWDYETGLQLCGKLVDTVSAAGTTRLSYDESGDAVAQIRSWWKEAKQLANERIVRSPGSSMNIDAFQSLCHQLSFDNSGFYRGDGRTKRRASLLVELDPTQDAEHRAQQTLIFGSIRGRILFVTSTGWLGLAPHGTQEGDLIYVILGSSVPYVLRPRKDEAQAFELIGEAYVQGIMNGEALEMDWLGIEDVCVR